ncbi:1-aminocyclopropane-1-carboxylate deaminase/D-cysteine desulfhydrase [Polaribacter sp. MED152]|uniref:1-aminocyclopropane-1-carboxylate deaminase/D-cysteine desulfhydrase n=1 Tax=Polaribacter sp. MED152 TaxID=313598 RepID=UPI0000689B1F|nr:pyridoxal-phosphate dependent enzyme [Polaribacter sp. MED152]EAQ40622.1 D-cysteine desulfhydrase family protein [Polaribacter sp. MED152]
MDFNKPYISENHKIELPILTQKNVALYIKREDEIHPFVSGNKFRKLKYNLAEAKKQNKATLLTFGGAFSNHIVATAVAGNLNGFKTIGIIRGEELANDLEKTLAENATLREAHLNGMTFRFISRADYRNKEQTNFIADLSKEFGDFYLIPEGGTNQLAIKGCEEILTNQDAIFDYICLAVGTGGTISGVINSLQDHQKCLGFPALKGIFLEEEIKKYVKSEENWSLQTDYHFGGYAKYNDDLIRFINTFKNQTDILLDPVYTAKMVYGVLDLIGKNHFPVKTKILAIHTGGLQGIVGFNKKLAAKNQSLIQQ